jgi:hypothetical protein
MWFTIGGSVLAGGIMATLIGLIFKNRILRKAIEARIPELKEEYLSDLARAESIIENNLSDIERLEDQTRRDKERKAEIYIHAIKIIQVVSDGR